MSQIQHYELNTSDPDAAKAFYAAVFGWKYQDMPIPGGGVYTMISDKAGPFGGIQRKPMESVPDHWLGYISVDNIEKAIAKAEKAGGTNQAGIIDIPGMGKYAVFTDPTGSVFAMWEQVAPAAPPAKKKAAKKKAAKKKTKKKAAKKTAKKTAKKAAKKTAQKKAAKKKAPKKAAKKKAAKKAPKKAAKKTAQKKAAKKAPKKAAKKKTKKKAAKKK